MAAADNVELTGLNIETIITVWGPLGLVAIAAGIGSWKILQRLFKSYEDRLKENRDSAAAYNQFSVVVNTLAESIERQNVVAEKQAAALEKIHDRLANLERIK